MGQIANVEYFYSKCNKELGTNYLGLDWGGEGYGNIKRAINVEWLVKAANKVYLDIHKPKDNTTADHFGCTLLLSSRFKSNISKIAVDKILVDEVVNYLACLNRVCDNECACYRDLNCNCVCASHCTCNGTNHCTGAYQCNCNCACECGSNSECVCDCQPYDCNCACKCGNKDPSDCDCNCTTNCGVCTCNCYVSSDCTCNCR